MNARSDCAALTPDWLASNRLAAADPNGDKEGRGHVLVVAGSREMPGAAMLAAMAALGAGAGKLTIVTAASTARALAIALPEARVIGAPEAASGALLLRDLPVWCGTGRLRHDAVLIGPGLQGGCAGFDDATPDVAAAAQLDRAAAGPGAGATGRPERAGPQPAPGIAECQATLDLLDRGGTVPMLVDAAAMDAIPGPSHGARQRLLTPHAGELAHLLDRDKRTVLRDPERAAADAAARWGVYVLLKGATTVLASPQGVSWRHDSCHPGLGTSGSGDVLAGTITGLLAQGASLGAAAAWGVALHARCAERLARRIGPIGYLARDIVAQIPRAALDLQLREPASA